jgi:hypothetical protein
MTGLVFLAPAFAATSPDERERPPDYSKMTPDATIEITAKSFKLLLGGSWGDGVLHYKGKAHPFKAKAGSIGGIGYKNLVATGNVYQLKSLDDFPGLYSGGAVGVTAGTKGGASAQLENLNEVVLIMSAKGEGAQLALSLGSLNISWAE